MTKVRFSAYKPSVFGDTIEDHSQPGTMKCRMFKSAVFDVG